MIGERLGIASAAQERTRRFAERHPALARFFTGARPIFQPAKQHRITVDLKTGTRHVEREVNQIIVDPDYKGMPSILAIMRRHELRRFRETQKKLRESKKTFRWEPLDPEYAAHVVRAVCAAWNVDDYRVLSPSKKRQYVYPRNAIIMILHASTKASSPSIGKFLRRDHSTVLHGLALAKRLLIEDAEWRANYDAAMAILNETAVKL
ncbi:MAG: hypothetical protein KGS44_13260 [Alphaproteobacteria bacterium]|nr:hypothetical protein [Alphaproteobacteria bacterium]